MDLEDSIVNKKQSEKGNVNGVCICICVSIFSYNHALNSMASASVWRSLYTCLLMKLGRE